MRGLPRPPWSPAPLLLPAPPVLAPSLACKRSAVANSADTVSLTPLESILTSSGAPLPVLPDTPMPPGPGPTFAQRLGPPPAPDAAAAPDPIGGQQVQLEGRGRGGPGGLAAGANAALHRCAAHAFLPISVAKAVEMRSWFSEGMRARLARKEERMASLPDSSSWWLNSLQRRLEQQGGWRFRWVRLLQHSADHEGGYEKWHADMLARYSKTREGTEEQATSKNQACAFLTCSQSPACPVAGAAGRPVGWF